MTITNINTEIRALCEGTSSTDLLDDATLLRRVNQAYEDVISFIMGCDGKWQFDDTSYTDVPIGITTLVAGQQDYTFATDVLEVEQVSVLDSAGNFQLLKPLDIHELGVDPSEFAKEDGMPQYYDKQGRSLLLYPAPASGQATLTNGLKVTFKRTADLYTSAQVTTGTKTPGFALPFHIIIAFKASMSYCAAYKPKVVPYLVSEVQRLEKGLAEHYGRREQDRRKRITTSGISFM